MQTAYPIELLWLIPIIMLAGLIFGFVMFLQRRAEAAERKEHGAGTLISFPKPVAPAAATAPADSAERRLGDLEQKIGVLTTGLSDQQRLLEKFQKENMAYEREVKELKRRLHDLSKEHDVVLSENFSLKAKMKRMSDDRGAASAGGVRPPAPAVAKQPDRPPASGRQQRPAADPAQVNKRLFGDTRMMKALDLDDTKILDDTSEVDLSELQK